MSSFSFGGAGTTFSRPVVSSGWNVSLVTAQHEPVLYSNLNFKHVKLLLEHQTNWRNAWSLWWRLRSASVLIYDPVLLYNNNVLEHEAVVFISWWRSSCSAEKLQLTWLRPFIQQIRLKLFDLQTSCSINILISFIACRADESFWNVDCFYLTGVLDQLVLDCCDNDCRICWVMLTPWNHDVIRFTCRLKNSDYSKKKKKNLRLQFLKNQTVEEFSVNFDQTITNKTTSLCL